MTTDQSLERELAREAENRIVESVIDRLEATTKGLQSGEDSRLENIWEEICVQVQGEESVLFQSYQDLIDALATEEIEKLDRSNLCRLWLRTDNGIDWSCDHEDDTSPTYCIDDIARDIRSRVLSEAADFENDRTYNYIWGISCDEDTIDEEFDD